MEYFCHTVQGSEIHLYPLVCWHLGARQSDEKFIKKVVRTIKEDPLAAWIYLGDGGECNIKESKGDIYSQTMSPGDQLESLLSLVEPIKDKGLFGVSGNHGRRVYKSTGLDWDLNACARMGIPYFRFSCLGNIFFSEAGSKMRSASFFATHGSSSSISAGGKVNAAKKFESYVNADVVMSAHTHACGETFCPKHYAAADSRNRSIIWKTVRSYACGSAYDSRTGYAEEKGYQPILPEHIVIRIKMPPDGRNIIVSHRKITTFPGDSNRGWTE